MDKNNAVQYNDIEKYADDYKNNQFEGTWKSHKGKLKKTCNWGDYRIPSSRGLDIGAGEFSPADKYLANGWQSIRDQWAKQPLAGKGKKTECAKWWE